LPTIRVVVETDLSETRHASQKQQSFGWKTVEMRAFFGWHAIC
jgi:hypothetical protein